MTEGIKEDRDLSSLLFDSGAEDGLALVHDLIHGDGKVTNFDLGPSEPSPSLVIESIKLDGFGPHNGPNHIRMSNGLTVLTGENGTGKTHILLAIHWCLFGERGTLDPWMAETDPLGKDLVNWNRRKEGRMSVELIFSWNGTSYRTVRRFGNGKEEFSIRDMDRGTIIDGGGPPSGLTSEILPFLIFQGEAVMFLASEDPFLREGNLKDVIGTLSGASRIQRGIRTMERARDILMDRTRIMMDTSGPMEIDLQTVREKVDDTRSAIISIKKEISELTERRKHSLSGYRKAIKELSGTGKVSREEKERAMAKARVPLI